jgi:hypothetical protein
MENIPDPEPIIQIMNKFIAIDLPGVIDTDQDCWEMWVGGMREISTYFLKDISLICNRFRVVAHLVIGSTHRWHFEIRQPFTGVSRLSESPTLRI